MKILLSRLYDFLPTKPGVTEVTRALSQAGLEIDETTYLGEGLDKVIVAEVKSFTKHPQADRLRLCEIWTGAETLQVVCGATNFQAGDKVCLAMVGARLPNGLQIKASVIRGVASAGMLCSESELGFKNQSDGILVLPAQAPLGLNLVQYFQRDDHVLTLDITPNRGDCLSVVGVAREVAAVLNIPHQLPFMLGDGSSGNLPFHIEVPEACWKYALRHLVDVKVTDSPAWLVQRLTRSGGQAINCVVDVTNYVMQERGQPLHAFDAKKIAGAVYVRMAKPHEKITLLDGRVCELEETDLVIADERGPIALAGIMGGLETAVTLETQEVLLESAWFNPGTIRQTAKRLNLHTEASHRFERSVDIEGVWSASSRAVQLLSELCGAQVLREGLEYPKRLEPRKLVLRSETLRRVLGEDVKAAGELLSRLGLSVEKMEGVWNVEVPPRRSDITREIDLVEEVARLYGYQALKSELPKTLHQTWRDPTYAFKDAVRSFMVGQGFYENVSLSFVTAQHAQDFKVLPDLEEALGVVNPIRSDLDRMRNAILPSLIQNWVYNRDRQLSSARFFEIGQVFSQRSEHMHLCALFAGEGQAKGLWQEARKWDYFDMKGLVESLSVFLGVERQVSFSQDQPPAFLHPHQSSWILFRKKKVGCLGILHPRFERTYDCGSLVLLELRLDDFKDIKRDPRAFKSLSAFPFVERDFAFVVEHDVAVARLTQCIEKLKDIPLQAIELFDVYQGKGVAEGFKSIACRVRLSSHEKTLTEADIQAASDRIIQAVTKDLGATLRV